MTGILLSIMLNNLALSSVSLQDFSTCNEHTYFCTLCCVLTGGSVLSEVCKYIWFYSKTCKTPLLPHTIKPWLPMFNLYLLEYFVYLYVGSEIRLRKEVLFIPNIWKQKGKDLPFYHKLDIKTKSPCLCSMKYSRDFCSWVSNAAMQAKCE